jgi:hypothetical protein
MRNARFFGTDNRTDQIKSRMGGFIQTAFWEVRSETFGS